MHWLLLAGRGFGKTRTGAEWVRHQVEQGKAKRIALVAPTVASGRAVMVEGDSGLLAVCPPWSRPKFEVSKRMLTWPNGATATLFSAEEPERLRGPQHDAAWCDELCAWRRADDTWDMGFRYREQVNGPALSYFQIEPATLNDLYDNYLHYRPGRQLLLDGYLPEGMSREEALATDDRYACAAARMIYARFPEAIPTVTDEERMAEYCKQYWNTPLGAATPEKYLDDYHRYGPKPEPTQWYGPAA